MKIVHVTTSTRGGAGIAAMRLHRALREAGVASAFVSTNVTVNFDGTTVQDSFFDYERPSFLQKLIRKLQTVFGTSYPHKVKSKIKSLSSDLQFEMLTTPFSPYNINDHPIVQQADIVNLHWVGKMVDYPSFFSSNAKPVVWTLHDMNPFKGLFHYLEDEKKNYNVLGAVDVRIKALKAAAIQRVERGAIVSPSNWLLSEAKDSGVFNHFEIMKCIANPVDLEVFKIQKKDALRKERNISNEGLVLLFTAGRIENRRKGMKVLLRALNLVKTPVTLLTLGKGKVMHSNDNITVIPLGFASNPEQMAGFYSMADVFVLPSKEDNLPNTMLEAFASGTPVVSFAIGGMKDHVQENTTGILASEMNARDLATALDRFYENKNNYKPQHVRAYAEANFSFGQQASKYIEVYRQLLT